MEDDLIVKTIGKIRNKMWISKVLKATFYGTLIASIVLLFIIILSHFYSIVFLWKKVGLICGGIIILSLIAGIVRRPSVSDAARFGDSLGLEDRLITYLQYMDVESEMIYVFKDEVQYTIEDVNLLEKYKFFINIKGVFSVLIIFLLSIGIYLLPSQAHTQSANMENANNNIKKQAYNIKEIQNKMSNGNIKDEFDNKEVEVLKNLTTKLNKSCDYQKAQQYINEAQSKIDEIERSRELEQMKAFAGMFNGCSKEYKALQDSLNSGDISSAEEISLSEKFNDMDKQKIIENLDKQIANAKNQSTKDKLTQIKSNITDKGVNGKNLKEQIKSLQAKNHTNDINKLEDIKKKLFAKSQGEKGINSATGDEKSSSFSEGNIKSYNNGEKSDSQSFDIASGGLGENPMENPNGVGGGGKKASGEAIDKVPEGKVGKKDVSTRLGDNVSTSSQIKGKWNEGGDIYNKEIDYAITSAGKYDNIKNTYVEFKNEGMQYVIKQDIPMKKRNLVIKYFKLLNGGNINAGGAN